MEVLLKEILAELKAIRIILSPSSANNHFGLRIIPNSDCSEDEQKHYFSGEVD